MRLSTLTFIVTDACNFNCVYCRQKKGNAYLSTALIKDCIHFFYLYLADDCEVTFYGGEPLLAFDRIREAVTELESRDRGEAKNFKYAVTTNGSLLDADVVEYLAGKRFTVYVSFDGTAQEILRRENSSRRLRASIRQMLDQPHLDLAVICVCTPQTVSRMSRSVACILGLGVPGVRLSLDFSVPWDEPAVLRLRDEFARLRSLLLSYAEITGSVPLINFRGNSPVDVFRCGGGVNRMALAPDGTLWGCHRAWAHFSSREAHADYHKYCFGELGVFFKNHKKVYPRILGNYSNLRHDYSWTSEKFCKHCDELEGCEICPFSAAVSGSVIGKIPPWVCRLIRLERREKDLFWRNIAHRRQGTATRGNVSL